MTVARSQSMLEQLEAEARDRGLLLRLQVGRPLGLWSLRLVVAQQGSSGNLLLLGEMKGWGNSSPVGMASARRGAFTAAGSISSSSTSPASA